ncbi:hypothetical protein PENTCL1PPCAC_14084 [Pristionchus entomophagus]|uniref:G protein-coupled receptor n=1 Tax=Pristionchus entomophagus TaxID=358040 RepID=A0AAV5T9C0_9BILA|nr:hypothetical protein PENTCL1PPCAC_14084 [Pristionchus entomophagus]
MVELEECLKDGFSGPTNAERLTVGIPLAILAAVGVKLNIVLWRIIIIKKVILYTSFTVALDRFLTFASPRIYEYFTGYKHYILVLLSYGFVFIIIFRTRRNLGRRVSLKNRDFIFYFRLFNF